MGFHQVNKSDVVFTEAEIEGLNKESKRRRNKIDSFGLYSSYKIKNAYDDPIRESFFEKRKAPLLE
jgi:hypothetical protein